jgi:hypothetical protein
MLADSKSEPLEYHPFHYVGPYRLRTELRIVYCKVVLALHSAGCREGVWDSRSTATPVMHLALDGYG